VDIKTRQYCACPQMHVNIYLSQVDWRGLAPQIIQYPETPLPRRKPSITWFPLSVKS